MSIVGHETVSYKLNEQAPSSGAGSSSIAEAVE